MTRGGDRNVEQTSSRAAAAGRAVEEALAAGADDAEAYASEESSREIRAHGGEVESLTAATGRGVGVRAWIGTGWLRLRNRPLRGRGPDDRGRRAEAAAAADEDEFAGPPREAAAAAAVENLVDPSVAEWPPSGRRPRALGREGGARRRRARRRGRAGGLRRRDRANRVSSSAGAGGEFEASSCRLPPGPRRGRRRRETGLGFGLARGPDGLDLLRSGRGGRAGDRDDRRRQAGVPILPGRPRPTVAASFVGLLGSTIGADAVQRGRSPSRRQGR